MNGDIMLPQGPGLGHNRGPEDMDDTTFEERLEARLDIEDKAMFDRLAELEIGQKNIPELIEDQEVAERTVSWIAQCRHAVGDLVKAHKRNKAPILALGKWLDGRYIRRKERFERDVVSPVERRVSQFHARVREAARLRQEEERRRAERLAEAQRQEAARLAAEARAKEEEGNRREAVRLAREAEAAEKERLRQEHIAEKPDEQPKIQGELGAVAYTHTTWRFAVVDPELLPDQFWMPDETAIREAMNFALKAGKTPSIPGVEFTEEHETRFRR